MATASLSSEIFGSLPTGESVESWTIAGAGGLVAEILTYGGIVRRLFVPGRNGRLDDVVLGFNQLDSYLEDRAYFGAIVGRVAGRIPRARFILEGKTHELAANESTNHLHGGRAGFNKKRWKATPCVQDQDRPSLRLEYFSPDGEEGYPGSVQVAVTYTVTPDNSLFIQSEATSDRTTPFSLTYHLYFNLAGESAGTVAGHELQIHADQFVAVDENLAPLGELRDVTSSNDFRHLRRVEDAIPHLFQSHGDLYRIHRLPGRDTPGCRVPAARLVHQSSGRVMEVSTTTTYLQFYSGVGLNGSLAGKHGSMYGRFAGVCLECEGSPLGVSDPSSGGALLCPGRLQSEVTQFSFGTL